MRARTWGSAFLDNHLLERTSALRADCHDDAWEFIKADHLRLEKLALTKCYERLCRAAAQHGWPIPSLDTVPGRIDDIPVEVQVMSREGKHARIRLNPSQQRSVAQLNAL